MFEEKNTANNLPAQIDIAAMQGHEYKFTFIQKGGGSANKTFLHQKTKAVLNPDSLKAFLKEAISLARDSCLPALPSCDCHWRHLC
jgi:fumarate hydratase class I